MSTRDPAIGIANRYTKCMDIVPSINRIRYMPDKKNIVKQSQVAALRTAEQIRILNDPVLAPFIREWHRGGGLYDVRAFIHHSAFIGLCAIIDENAWLGKGAHIDGRAMVDGTIAGNAYITDDAQIGSGCWIKGKSTVGGHAHISDGVILRDSIVIGGNMDIHGDVVLGGSMHIIGDFCITKSHVDFGSCVIDKEKQWKAIRSVFNTQTR
jgi:acyl-[acyl carrier protein]--UDP-N-acetylglucosamine O-acyltransferase